MTRLACLPLSKELCKKSAVDGRRASTTTTECSALPTGSSEAAWRFPHSFTHINNDRPFENGKGIPTSIDIRG